MRFAVGRVGSRSALPAYDIARGVESGGGAGEQALQQKREQHYRANRGARCFQPSARPLHGVKIKRFFPLSKVARPSFLCIEALFRGSVL